MQTEIKERIKKEYS